MGKRNLKEKALASSGASAATIPRKKRFSKEDGGRLARIWDRDKYLYLLCLPALVYMFVFDIIPMYGITLAFKDYKISKGIFGSEWVWFDNFIQFFNYPNFWQIIQNTLSLSLYSLLTFPIPIFLALVLNQMRNKKHQKFIQTVMYLPHFISMTVMCGMIVMFLSPSIGIINELLNMVGIESIYFMGIPEYFSHVFVWSGEWQNAGWNMIVYLAALATVDSSLYEAAEIDGAHRFHMIRYIDIPAILPTVLTMFILRIGNVMNVGFQKVYLLQNPTNLEVARTLQTYVYEVGIVGGRFSYATAISLFNTMVNIMLLIIVSQITRRINGTNIYGD